MMCADFRMLEVFSQCSAEVVRPIMPLRVGPRPDHALGTRQADDRLWQY